MKTTLSILLLAALSMLALADDTVNFAEPVLLTSCGQSADGLSMKILLTQDSIALDYKPQATDTDVAGKASLVLVIGGSSKGLGAAKISSEDEIARVTKIIDAAKKLQLPILAAHLGGQSRRGSLSDAFNKLGAENADHLIVVKGGDDDGFFARIAEEKKIPIQTAATTLEVAPLLKPLFGK